ncbi:hypothetical protein K488DRAFT_32738, partial [Vararia minispora EC-137]
AVFMSVMTVSVLYNLPRDASRIQLAGIRDLAAATPDLRPLLPSIPKDPRTLYARYNLDPITDIMVCCSECYYSTPLGACPFFCEHKPTPGSRPCNTPLLEWTRIRSKWYKTPRLKYEPQNFRLWLGRLLLRPGFEQLVDSAFRGNPQTPMRAIGDGTHLRQAQGPSGHPFFPGPFSETRLALAYCIDGFNPFGMKTAKQTVSCTAIWLIKHRLVIPGPNKPSVDQINHANQLIVDTMKVFYDPGVYYSSTAEHSLGRLVRCLLPIDICDAIALRQIVSTTSVTSKYFCIQCELPIQQIENINPSTWTPRDPVKMKQQAMAWRDAPDEKSHVLLAEQNGIHWTPFYELPYWNPVSAAIPEPMHIMQNLIEHHLRVAWGISVRSEGGDGSALSPAKVKPRPPASETERFLQIILQAQMEKCLCLLAMRRKKSTVIGSASSNALRRLCHGYGLDYSGTKDDLYERLTDYTEQNVLPPVPSDPRTVLGKSVMESCWASMKDTTLPSWVSGAPRNWGTATCGKLSADQWNVICTIHLPFTLISRWDIAAAPERDRKMLDNYMDLVRVVETCGLREITEEQIQGYTRYIRRYLEEYKVLYKGAKIKPNHHLAIHYGDVLRSFGPTPGHQAQPYERFINFLHQLPTNMRFGELESTFMRASGRSANLSSLITDYTPDHEPCELLKVYYDIVQRDSRGTRLAYMTDSKILFSVEKAAYRSNAQASSVLDSRLYRLLADFLNTQHPSRTSTARELYPAHIPIPREVEFIDRVAIRGVRYSVYSSLPRDSHIMFRSTRLCLTMTVGEIQKMFVHTHEVPIERPPDPTADEMETTSLMLLVRPFQPLSGPDVHLDAHFRKYGISGGFCCHRTKQEEIMIDASSVICHAKVTLTTIENKPLLHVKALDRVCSVYACY